MTVLQNRLVDPVTGLGYSAAARAIAMTGLDAWAVHYRALAAQAKGEDVIVLSVGDPDFDTPRPIADKAVAAIRDGCTRYTPAGGIQPLVEAIAARESERLRVPVAPEEVVVCGGAQNALYTAMRCLVDPGDEVILFSPPYTMFEGVVRAAGAEPVLVPLDLAGGGRIDMAAFEAAITPRTRAVLLNLPHNPSGAIADAGEIAKFATLIRELGLWLLSDEVYADLCFDGRFFSPASLDGMKERTVVIRSLSKTHAMTGWRVGWAVAPAALCAHMRNLLNHVLYGSPGFIQMAAVAALTEEIAEVGEMARAYRERRDYLCDALDRVAGLDCRKPASGIFCIVGIAALGLPARAFAERLFEAEGVAVLPGDAFGADCTDWVRLSLCQPTDVLAEAVTRMSRFIATLV